MTTFGDFCSGGGGFALGAKAAGAEVCFGVEIDPDIAQVYKDNLGDHVLCQPLETVDMVKLPSVDHVHISPPCQQFSVARSKTLENRKDGDVGILLLDYVAIHSPRMVTLENVPPYKDAPVFHAILAGLHSLGYRTQWSIENAANYGVAQTRKRLILRAARPGEMLLPLVPTHAKEPGEEGLFGPALLPWNGWYGAIEDILDTLPESAFAPWQLTRLPKDLFGSVLTDSCVNTIEGRQATCRTSLDPAFTIKADAMRRPITTPKAPLVEGDAAGDRPPTCRTSAEPAFTLKKFGAGGGRVHRALLCGVQGEGGELARDGVPPSPTITSTHGAGKYRAFIVSDQTANGGAAVGVPDADSPCQTVDTRSAEKTRAALEQGRVVSMTPQALMAFQSFPKDYKLPVSRSLASKIIGNAVPPLLAQAICGTLPGGNA